MARKFTTAQADRYLTAKSRGAKFVGRDLVYTPELIQYVSKHSMQQDLNNALRARAELVYSKGLPKTAKNLSKLARIEYKETVKQARIKKAELARYLYDDSTRNNLVLARRLSSYENYRLALRESASFYEEQSLGRLVGMLGNTINFKNTKVSKSDMATMLGLVDNLGISLNKFYKLYEYAVSMRYGSDDVADELLSIGENVKSLTDSNYYTGEMKNKAEQLVNLMSKYGLL